MQDEILLRTSRLHGLTMIELCGDLDCYNTPQIKERLMKLIENGEHDLILNLNRVDFVDSVGLAALTSVHQRILAFSGTLRIVCTNRITWRVFEITGLQRMFPVFHDEIALTASLDAK